MNVPTKFEVCFAKAMGVENFSSPSYFGMISIDEKLIQLGKYSRVMLKVYEAFQALELL